MNTTSNSRTRKQDQGDSGAYVSVRLRKGTYDRLLRVKGALIQQSGRNIGLSDTVESLLGIAEKRQSETPQ